MPRISVSLPRNVGPHVAVTITPSGQLAAWLAKRGRGQVVPINTSMLLDTGSEVSVLTESRLAIWGTLPSPASGIKLATLAGPTKLPAHELDIAFHDQLGNEVARVDRVLVGAAPGRPWAGHPYHGVIGRDVLDRISEFIYGGGPPKGCTLHFP